MHIYHTLFVKKNYKKIKWMEIFIIVTETVTDSIKTKEGRKDDSAETDI